jgi:hypothetical protein
MKFQEVTKAIEIEFLDEYQIQGCHLKIRSTVNNIKSIDGLKGILNFLLRSASLDGGTPLNFSVAEKLSEGCLLIEGNLIDIINALSQSGFISESSKNNILSVLKENMIHAAGKLSELLPTHEAVKFSFEISQVLLGKK